MGGNKYIYLLHAQIKGSHSYQTKHLLLPENWNYILLRLERLIDLDSVTSGHSVAAAAATSVETRNNHTNNQTPANERVRCY